MALTSIFYDRKNNREVKDTEMKIKEYKKIRNDSSLLTESVSIITYGEGLTCDYVDLVFLRFE